jgi:CubicO group peptidase (beta-lactamase class C family)
MSRIQEEILKAIDQKVFPGASLLVASKGDILCREFFGDATLLPSAEPVTERTLFDIASLAKPVATATIFLISAKEKGLSLTSPASKYLKELGEEDKEKITIRHLLKHTSGLPAWRPYYEEIAREHPETVGKRESRQYYVEKISQEPLEMPIAYQRIYSDLGFILLGILIEDFWEKSLDRIFLEKVATPLEMEDTFFIPVGARSPLPQNQFAATEESAWRKKLIRGEVHDDNAYTLGGVAGHAGLFSTVDDLHRFLVAFEKGYRGEHPGLPRDLVHEFVGTKVKSKLGWDTPSQENSQAGKYFSRNSIGHLGYTGCSFWADLNQDFHVILLTNRVHPSSKNEAIKQFRPKIHDIIYEDLVKR